MIYSITQAISDGTQYCTYLTSAMIDNYADGNKDEASKQAINANLVRAMVEALEFYQLNGSDTGFTQTTINNIIHRKSGMRIKDVFTLISGNVREKRKTPLRS